MVDGLEYPDVQEAYRHLAGLCMPHFRQALERADVWRAKLLTEVQLAQLEKVALELQQLDELSCLGEADNAKAARWAAGLFAGKCP